jgi:SulP family sulfate permease
MAPGARPHLLRSRPLRPLLASALPIAGWLPGWRRTIRVDTLAALAVWAVLVPQAMAYASLAGLPAKHGLYAALPALVLYAIFGTSRQLNVGPSSAVAVLSAATVAPIAAGDPKRYAAVSAALALAAGIVLVVAGIARLGFVSDFIARPVLAGYLVGLGVVIVVGQAPKLLGIEGSDGTVFDKAWAVVTNADELHWQTVAVGVGSLAFMLVLRRATPRVPAALIVVVAGVVASSWLDLDDEGVDILGPISTGLPAIGAPGLPGGIVTDLAVGALGVALLAFAESIAAARTFAEKHGHEIDANRELVAIGATNVGAGLAQGFAVDASASRSAVGDEAGQRTQLASLVNAVLIVATLLLLARFFESLPQSTLAAIVIAAVLGMLSPRPLRQLWRLDRVDAALGVICFGGVLVLGVLGGIVLAVVAALVALVYRSFRPNTAVLGRVPTETRRDEDVEYRDIAREPGLETVPGLVIYRFDQELFFANASLFEREVIHLVRGAEPPSRAVLVDAAAISHIDTTGMAMIERLHRKLGDLGVTLMLARPRGPLRDILHRSGLDELIGPENVFPTVRAGVASFLHRAP